MKKLLSLALIASAFMVQTAQAAPLYLGVHYQWGKELAPYEFDNNSDPANGFGILGGYKFNDHWSAEINFDHFKFADSELTHNLTSIAGVYRYKTGFIVPFARIGLGVGENSFDADGVPTKRTFAGHIGGGAEFNFKPVTVYAGARLNYLGETAAFKDASSVNIMIGLIIPTFGAGDDKTAERISEAVTKATESVVAAVKDTDGDGVSDDQDKCPNTAAGTKVNSYGCADKEKAVVKINVEFLAGKTDVQSKYESEIEKLAVFMKEHPETKVEIAGHTDKSGAAKANTVLSQKRAESVAQVLVKKFGISQNRIKAKGYGSSRPITENKTAAGREANRRVEAEISI